MTITRMVLLIAESLGHLLGRAKERVRREPLLSDALSKGYGRILTRDRPDQLDQLDQLDRDAYPKAISAAMMDRQRNPDKWLDTTNPMPDYFNLDDWRRQ